MPREAAVRVVAVAGGRVEDETPAMMRIRVGLRSERYSDYA